MANILVLVPMKEGLTPALIERALELLNALDAKERAIGEHTVETHARMCAELGDGRAYSAHANARNKMLDWCLTNDHTHILWIDADVVEYPSDLATRLHAIDSEGIIAPYVLIEGTKRFYDVQAFIDSKGRHARPWPPYLDRETMQSVGTCYLAPAWIYQKGGRYSPLSGHTEHLSICRLSPRVSSTSSVVVYHANLPAYGEDWHTP